MNSIAKNVIETELEGLKALLNALEDDTDGLGSSFTEAINMMRALQGRVIITGMGKSGHIARKISATLASTGTLSVYVHPAEANHGDLGMISENDLVIAISNSGGTTELSGIMGYVKRFNIPIIAITSGKNSVLDKASTLTLLLPDTQEACHVTNAPTTSTLMTLALGDALAVTLMKSRGFTSDDFHKFHPGGKLGAALKKISSIMRPLDDTYTCPEESMLEVAIEKINTSQLGFIGVVSSDGKLAGIITDGDIRRQFGACSASTRVEHVMTNKPICVHPNEIAAKGLHILSDKKITSLFVINKAEEPVGIIHIHDFLEQGVI